MRLDPGLLLWVHGAPTIWNMLPSTSSVKSVENIAKIYLHNQYWTINSCPGISINLMSDVMSLMGTGCFGPKHTFLQSLKFGMLVLAWADSSVPATCVGELHGPNHPY